jgi:hypothetical protein
MGGDVLATALSAGSLGDVREPVIGSWSVPLVAMMIIVPPLAPVQSASTFMYGDRMQTWLGARHARTVPVYGCEYEPSE